MPVQYPRSTGHTRLISPIASGAPQILRKDTGTLTRSSVPASRSSVPGTMSVSLYLFKPGCRKDTGTRKRYRDTDSEQATDTQRGDQAAASAYPRVGASGVCVQGTPSLRRRIGDSPDYPATETRSPLHHTQRRRLRVSVAGRLSVGDGLRRRALRRGQASPTESRRGVPAHTRRLCACWSNATRRGGGGRESAKSV